MFRSIAMTLDQLGDPRLRGALVTAILVTLGLIVALSLAVGVGVDALQATGIGWLDQVLGWVGAFGAVVLALLFFPGMVQLVSGLFLDRVAAAVEARHYPAAGPGRSQPLTEVVGEALRFAAVSVGLNLLVLPLYLLLPGLNLVLFYGLNGYLLGREYAEMIAVRRLDPRDVRAFRQRNQGALFLDGVVIAVLATVPLLNLAMPVLATAFALHEHHRLSPGTLAGKELQAARN